MTDSFDRFVAQDATAIVNAALSTKRRGGKADKARDAFLAQLRQPELAPDDRQGRFARWSPELSDTTPPREPPTPAQTDPDVKPAIVRAWRHDGGMQSFPFYSEQAAREHADDLSPVIYWKAVVVDPSGRAVLYKRTIEAINEGKWWNHD